MAQGDGHCKTLATGTSRPRGKAFPGRRAAVVPSGLPGAQLSRTRATCRRLRAPHERATMASHARGLLLVPLAIGSLAAGDERPSPPPALTVRLAHPDRQLAHLLVLFEGAKAPHPAAALAGWKRATRDPGGLGKPLE